MAVVQRQPWSLRQLIPSLLLLPVSAIYWKQLGATSPWEDLRVIGTILCISYVWFLVIRLVTSVSTSPDVQIPLLLDWLLNLTGWRRGPYKIFAARVFLLSLIETWIVLQILGSVVQPHNVLLALIALASIPTTFVGILLLHMYTERHAIRNTAYSEPTLNG